MPIIKQYSKGPDVLTSFCVRMNYTVRITDDKNHIDITYKVRNEPFVGLK